MPKKKGEKALNVQFLIVEKLWEITNLSKKLQKRSGASPEVS
jgi:hypothetical protein